MNIIKEGPQNSLNKNNIYHSKYPGMVTWLLDFGCGDNPDKLTEWMKLFREGRNK